jgi:hypothetical protein
MADETPFVLTAAERQSQLWLRIKGHLEDRLRMARGKLEGEQTEQQTAAWRGRIAELKGLLALGDEPPIDG